MKKNLESKATQAAKRFLELREYQVLDTIKRKGSTWIVAEQDDTIVFCKLSVSEIGLPKPAFNRFEFETVAAKYLDEHDLPDRTVRGDRLDFHLLPNDRAFLRHTRAASSAAVEEALAS